MFVQVFSDALYRFCLALNVLIAYCQRVSNFFLPILIQYYSQQRIFEIKLSWKNIHLIRHHWTYNYNNINLLEIFLMFGTLYMKEADNTLHDKNISFLIKHFIHDE